MQQYYKPKNKKEREARRLVYDRYHIMRDDPKRKIEEEQWDLGDKMFLQYVEPRKDGDWRSHVTLPDGFAGVQTHMQETIERHTRPYLKPVEVSDEALQHFGNTVINHNMDITGYDYQDYLAKQTAAIRGTSFTMEIYRNDKREIQDIVGVEEDGNLKYEKKIVTDTDDTYTTFVDNEFIFIDPSTADQNDLADMVHREILSHDEFVRQYSFKPDFMNIKLVPKAGSVDERAKFYDRPKDVEADEVEILHYYNQKIDAYYVLANNVLVRLGPIPYKHKMLPIAVHTHYNVPGQIWGLGIPKVIYSLTEERKSLRNINLDRANLNGNKMFLANDLVDLDIEDVRTRPHGIISVNTNGLRLDDVIKSIEYGDTPLSYYKSEEMLLEDIRRAHGINDQLQGNNVGGTATEAAILKETSQRRINLINMLSEMSTVIRTGRLKWSNIQFFYSAPRIEKIVVDNETKIKKTYRTIRSEGRQFDIVKNQATGKTELKFKDIEGESSFKLNKKFATFMDQEWDVTIAAEGKGVLSRPLKQAKATEMFNMLALNPQLMAVIDPQKATKRYLQINEEDPRAWMRESGMTTEDWRKMAMHENIIMAAGQALDATEGATVEHTEVHLDYMNTQDYADLVAANPAIEKIFEFHVFGEDQNSPMTAGGAGVSSLAGVAGDMINESRGGGGVGGGAAIQTADMQPSTVGGADKRDTQQANA